MIPEPSIRLASMIKSLEQLVLPALREDHPLEREQAAVTIGQLRLLERQWPYFERYAQRCPSDCIEQGQAILNALEPTPHLPVAATNLREAIAAANSATMDSAEDFWAARNAIAEAISKVIEAAASDEAPDSWQCVSAVVQKHSAREHYRDRVWFGGTAMDPDSGSFPTIGQMLQARDANEQPTHAGAD